MSYLANKRNDANITNIHYWDSTAAAWSLNLMGMALPYNLLPIVPAAGDFVLFGIDTTMPNSGPFCSLVFDLLTAQTDLTIVWRYSDAGILPTAWGALTVQDNTNADGAMTGQAFDTTAIKSVHWEQPATWVDTLNPTVAAVPLGVTGYWVCAHVTAIGAAPATPWQQNRHVYSITWPYVDVAAADIAGDVPALLRVRLRNQSDADFGVALSPALYAERVLIGARSLSRGTNFTAYLNAANEQNPAGITVGLFGAAAFTVDPVSPTGVKVQYLNVPALQSIMQWALDSTIASEYIGRYHAFIRAEQVTGAPGDITLQLSSTFALVSATSVQVPFIASALPELLDMGIVNLGAKSGGTIESIVLSIDGFGDGAADIDIYDLILLPVDEWAGDLLDFDKKGLSARLGGRRQIASGTYLRADGTNPKIDVQSTTRLQGTDNIAHFWQSVTAAPPVLQANASQRLWFLEAGLSLVLNQSKFEIAGSVQLTAVQRYNSMRGDR